jgi:hypothetical protein
VIALSDESAAGAPELYCLFKSMCLICPEIRTDSDTHTRLGLASSLRDNDARTRASQTYCLFTSMCLICPQIGTDSDAYTQLRKYRASLYWSIR